MELEKEHPILQELTIFLNHLFSKWEGGGRINATCIALVKITSRMDGKEPKHWKQNTTSS